MRPIIGITGRRIAAGAVSSYHPRFADLHVDMFWSDNGRRVHEAGGVPVLLPFESSDSAVVDRLDGLLITGGQDVHPDVWGGDPRLASDDADPRRDANVHDRERDAYELSLVKTAVSAGVPVLGICRGNQVLNVALGGTLVEDVPVFDIVHAADEAPPFGGHENHVVTFEPDTIVREIYGAASAQTNSWHHQAVAKCGPGVLVTGRAGDGTVESIELAGSPVLGVQWHPEWHLDLDPVFPWLVSEARRYRQSQTP